MPAPLSRTDRALLAKYEATKSPSLGRQLCYLSTAVWVLATAVYPFAASRGLPVLAYLQAPLTAFAGEDETMLPLPGALHGLVGGRDAIPLTPAVLVAVFVVAAWALQRAYHQQALLQEARYMR